jgi:hypothetical protein
VTAWQFLLQHSNSVGLAFDIVGAFLLARYGLPPVVSRGGGIFMGPVRRIGTDNPAARTAELYERRGHLGLCLLIIGFVFQFVASVWARCP